MFDRHTDPAHVGGDRRDNSKLAESVFEAELKDIRIRREKVFGAPLHDRANDVRQDLVGLALSGGGVRSAAFNNGLLEAFIQTGLIRWIDYMSTVSGGGYIGGCLATTLHEGGQATKAGDGENDSASARESATAAEHAATKRAPSSAAEGTAPSEEASAENSSAQGTDASGDAGERQCPAATREFWKALEFPPKQRTDSSAEDSGRTLKTPFYRGGLYVREGVQFMETLIWGCVCNLLVWGSLLIFLAALVALVWRALDFPWLTCAIRHIAPLWHSIWWNDYSRPFIYSGILFLVWGIWRFRLALKRRKDPEIIIPCRLRQVFCCAICGCAVGVAVLLGNSEMSNQHQSNQASTVRETSTQTFTILLGAVVTLLLPYLNPLRWARSEMRPVGRVEALLMGYAGLGLLFTVPFTAIYLFAREDLSGSATSRTRALAHTDFRWSPEFLARLRDESGQKQEPPTVGAYAYQSIANNWGRHSQKFADRLGRFATMHGCTDEVAKLREQADADEATLDGAFKLWDTVELACEKWEREAHVAWLRSLKERRLHFERAVRDAIGEHLAHVMETSVLSDNHVLTTLRKRFARYGTTDEEVGFFANMGNLKEGEEFLDKLWPQVLATNGALAGEELKQVNRLIFEASYPDLVRPRAQASFHMTWESDQVIRIYWILGAAAVFWIAAKQIDINGTSLQGFYREKLRDAYFVGNAKLSELDPTKVGGPYPIFCAALNFFDDVPWRVAQFSQTYTFIFSRYFCGSESLSIQPDKQRQVGGASQEPSTHGYAPTSTYCGNQLDVPTVAAISGAAFSPAIFRNAFMTFGTFFLNLRLGQWLKNPRPFDDRSETPRALDRRKDNYFAPSLPIIRDFVETVLCKRKKPEEWKYCFVSDGGHNDNLGLAPLVLRRCRLIIVSDASQDENYEFEPLLKFYRRIRMRFGMDMLQYHQGKASPKTFELAPLRPRKISARRSRERRSASQLLDAMVGSHRVRDEHDVHTANQSREHFILARLQYPEPEESALFVYLKPSFTGDEPVDLIQYRHENPAFPHDPTTDQMYSEDQVESYRRLGHHIGMRLCERLQRGFESSSEDLSLWDMNFTVEDLVSKLTHRPWNRYSYDDPRVAVLIKQLDTPPSQASAVRLRLTKIGRRVLETLCVVSVNRKAHSVNQRINALLTIRQILTNSPLAVRSWQLAEVRAMAKSVKEDDPSSLVQSTAADILDLAARLGPPGVPTNGAATRQPV